MLKVFLVEDEFVVREGIKKNIDWAAHGYEFCGEASDGELALPMIQKLQPDIVLTDIKMPFMDGIELSRLIKKEFPWMEIIILTGYEEFAYAKEAIKIGVAQYLSKPISGDELIREVDALSGRIAASKREREISERYKREMEENLQQEKKDFFRHLVSGQKSVPELLEMAKLLEMDISALYYNVLLIKLQSTSHTQEEYSKSVVAAEQKLAELESGMGLTAFDRNLEGRAVLLKADSEEELKQQQKEYIERFLEIVQANDHIRYYVGIGEPVNRLRGISASFEQASHAFAHRFFEEGSRVVDSANIGNEAYEQGEAFNIGSVDPGSIDRNKVREFLKTGDKEEVIYFVEEFFGNLGSNAVQSNVFRQYVVMDCYFCVSEFVEELQFSREELPTLDLNSGFMRSVAQTRQYIEQLLQAAIELRNRVAKNRYGDVVDDAVRYIEDNYADSELSLNMLASHVRFSPNHLSTIFSQQTGQTFIHFLTEYRMNKAKEMLRCTSKKSSEIAYDVGYKDPHYFSYLFKKTQGMTPTQYRGGKSQEGDDAE